MQNWLGSVGNGLSKDTMIWSKVLGKKVAWDSYKPCSLACDLFQFDDGSSRSSNIEVLSSYEYFRL